MAEFLLDGNIPSKIRVFNSGRFLSAVALEIGHSDTLIWEYAKAHQLTIVTKDVDFLNRLRSHGPPPRVVHIRCGNLKVRPFRAMVDRHWPTVEALLKSHNLIAMYEDTVLAVF